MNVRARFLSLLMVAALALTMSLPALAAVEDTGFSDVTADAWYADAVEYVRDNGLMSGASTTAFSPNTTMTRAMLATVLYRLAGSPTVSGSDSFTDTTDGAWYAAAVLWASQQGLVTGYGNGLFGVNDPVSREQISTILWRYAGSPAADGGTDFADESSIASYASTAVDWARANGIINGMPGNLFAPKSSATRAQVAMILSNYVQNNTQLESAPDLTPDPVPDDETNILVAYFTVPETSGTDAVAQASRVVEDGEVVGNVEFIARTIQEETGADLFAIETVQAYPGTHDALLDFVANEMAANARPELSTEIDLSQYDVIFLGYPIWNADLPMPVYTFLDEYDLSGKTVIPFSAHGGSGFAGTISTIASEEPGADVERDGFTVSRNNVSDAEDDIVEWVRELGYTQSTPNTSASVLVAYISNTGNTEAVAERIVELTDGDLAEIQRTRPYGDLQSEAQAEINNGTQPAITVEVDDISEYEVIFIGYPIWWDEAPAMIATFLAENDFDGKIIAPFCTSAYSSIDNSLHIFDELAPEAELADGLTANHLSAVPDWVSEVMAAA